MERCPTNHDGADTDSQGHSRHLGQIIVEETRYKGGGEREREVAEKESRYDGIKLRTQERNAEVYH